MAPNLHRPGPAAGLAAVAVLLAWLLPAACQLSQVEPVATPDVVPETEEQGVPPEDPAETTSDGVRDEVREVVRAVLLDPRELNVPEGGSARYRVALSAQPTGAVTVTPSATSAELDVQPTQLVFTTTGWQSAQTIAVTSAHDADARADAPVPVMHAARGGGYDGAAQAVLRVSVVEDDVSTLALAGGSAPEQAGSIGFEVSLSLAGSEQITVEYATGATQDTAVGGQDFAQAADTLTFAAASTAAQTIEITVHDDALHEAEELFTVTLRNPANAVLAGGGAEVAATGRIEDNDPAPKLRIEHASSTEGEGAMQFAVALAPASGRTVTVQYATADAGAEAGTDYTAASGTLTFEAGAGAATISVPIVDDTTAEPAETFTVALHNPTGASLAAATATGTIADNDADDSAQPLQLTALRVTGGIAMYPAFDPDIHHYALTCSTSGRLRIRAEAARRSASLTLLRANPNHNRTFTGTLDAHVRVDQDRDVAIRLSGGSETATYVIHCLPTDFPKIRVLKTTAGVSDGLMLVTPRYDHQGVYRFSAIIDNNGVPRFHRIHGINFRYYSNGPTIAGEKVRYSVGVGYQQIDLLSHDLKVIRTLRRDLRNTTLDAHDFLFTEDGDYLFNLRVDATRDLSERLDIPDSENNPFGTVQLTDSVLQVMTHGGARKFYWNSWNHLTIHPDCRLRQFPGQYAHLNAFQILDDGDIVASFRGCAQVLRIDGTSGAVEWKLGGTEETPDSDTEYLEIVGDDEGEFCGQHHVTLTDWDTVVLFDNGVFCLGPRKARTPSSRAVEYDISSGTQASFVREFAQPAGYGYSDVEGSVTVVGRNRWLIAWGRPIGVTANPDKFASIVEVGFDPATGAATTYLEIHMSKSSNLAWSYRVYRVPESGVNIPLNLP